MAVEVRMPKLDMTMEEATIIRWLKREGDWVEKGEPILEIMTEKVVMEVEAPASGILMGIKFGPDQVVPVGEIIAYILQPGETLEEIYIPEIARALPQKPEEKPQPSKPAQVPGPVRATPAARRLAKEHGIDITQVPPSGLHGEVTEEDVKAFLAHISPVPEFPSPAPVIAEKIPLQGWRRTIAQKMKESNQIPQIALTVEIDMTEAAQRKGSCSFTALIVYEVARILPKHPLLNSTLQGEEIIIYRDVNIGVAVATDKGLIVPVIKNASKKSLEEIDLEIKELAYKARKGSLSLGEISGGTFTVSNLGMFGIDQFQALINPPQAAILAVGKIEERPVIKGNRLVTRAIAKMTLSADHRILDGAVAAEFLTDLKAALEQPAPVVQEIKEPIRIAIIGGGFAGYTAALRASELGAQVLLVEKHKLGGTCLNAGCIPTKTLLEVARRIASLEGMAEHGIIVQGWRVDFQKVQARKENIVAKLVESVEQNLRKARVQVLKGQARFLSPTHIAIAKPDGREEEYEADRFIIATGSEPALIPTLPEALTSTQALELSEVPKSILIVGGGVIGVEFACLFSYLGSKVVIVEAMPTLLPGEDKDVAETIAQILRRKGVEILTQSTVAGRENADTIIITPQGEKRVIVEAILVAVGRKPYITHLGLEKAGVKTQRGSVLVNEYLETNVPGIFAAGDVTGRYFMAHVAAAEGKLSAENALGSKKTLDYTAVPRCIFTIPEIASVGLTEEEALRQGQMVSKGIHSWTSVEKAIIGGHSEGFVKIIAVDGVLAGVHIIGPEASSLIMEGAIALGTPLERLVTFMHPHPTLSEAIQRAAAKALGKSH